MKTYKKIYPAKNHIFPRQFSAPFFTNINTKNNKFICDRNTPKNNFVLSENIDISDPNKNSMNRTDYFEKIYKKKNLNSYYLFSNLPLYKNFLVEHLNHNILSAKNEKKIDIENNYKKIDKLSNDLCLFQIKRKFLKGNSAKNIIKPASKCNFVDLDNKSKDKTIKKQFIIIQIIQIPQTIVPFFVK